MNIKKSALSLIAMSVAGFILGGCGDAGSPAPVTNHTSVAPSSNTANSAATSDEPNNTVTNSTDTTDNTANGTTSDSSSTESTGIGMSEDQAVKIANSIPGIQAAFARDKKLVVIPQTTQTDASGKKYLMLEYADNMPQNVVAIYWIDVRSDGLVRNDMTQGPWVQPNQLKLTQ